MISIWVEQVGSDWFAVACHHERLVATAKGPDRARASRAVRRCLPRGAEHRGADRGSDFAGEMVRVLARLEAGEVESCSFDLCPDCVAEPLAATLRTAAAVPRGYATCYGAIAGVAGTEARVVASWPPTHSTRLCPVTVWSDPICP